MMEPIYRCGYQIPSLIKLVFKLICFITIPFLITMMVKNLIVTNGIAVDHSFSFIIYPISLLITLGFVYSYRTLTNPYIKACSRFIMCEQAFLHHFIL